MANWHWELGIASLAVLITGAAGLAYEWFGERRDLRRHPPPGRLVSVGDHKLHLLCKGTAPPTVVIEQGAGEASRLWWPLQDQIAEFASVCTYDRAGYGWSEAGPASQTVDERAEELYLLLANAGFTDPYILVAHSYGGLIVRSLARRHTGDVAGIVLVDTPEEENLFAPDVVRFYARARTMNRVVAVVVRFGVLRLLRHWVSLDRFGLWLTRHTEYSALCDELASIARLPAARRRSQEAGSLQAIPLAVITHGQPFPGPFAVLEKGWSEGQTRLAGLSSDSVFIVAGESNHMIHIDEPDVVVDVIRRMHSAVRDQRPLDDKEA